VATHFSHLLRYAWVTVGLFLFPGHHSQAILSDHDNTRIRQSRK
jgi:hypothetical protein